MSGIKHVHLMITGFTERRDEMSAGLGDLWYQIHKRYAGPDTINHLFHWFESPRNVARWIHRHCYNREEGTYPEIQIVGYSFGGQTAINVCRELDNLANITVRSLTLIDAVRRRTRWPIGWLSAFNRIARLTVPANVQRVDSFIQRQNWPRGHKVTNYLGEEVGQVELMVKHGQIDSHRIVAAHVLAAADAIHGGGWGSSSS